MTRSVFLRDAVAALPEGALSPMTRAAVLRHYDRRIFSEWLARRYLIQTTWGWS